MLRHLTIGMPAVLPALLLSTEVLAAGCPKMMNVGRFAGPGAGYEKPRVSVRCAGGIATVRTNSMPHYRFVRITPNPLVAQNFTFRLPLRPRRLRVPREIPRLGPVGIAVNGVVFFSPNEAARPSHQAWGDPVYNGIMDRCMGHTAREYHYHAFVQNCLAPGSRAGRPSPILGYAFDGYPIYGPWGCLDRGCRKVVRFRSSWVRTGDPTTYAWRAHAYRKQQGAQYLDRCNGRVGPDGTYRYHATARFPYIIGCYAGVPMAQPRNRRRGGFRPEGRGPRFGRDGRRPPPRGGYGRPPRRH